MKKSFPETSTTRRKNQEKGLKKPDGRSSTNGKKNNGI